MYFLPKKKLIIQNERVIKSVHKTDSEKGGGVRQMLTMDDKGGKGGRANADIG